jgi:hypothetical protein
MLSTYEDTAWRISATRSVPCDISPTDGDPGRQGLTLMRFHTEPDTDWKNIFQLLRQNGEKLPFTVAKGTWSADASHYLVAERVEIKKWPYGSAWGQYHWKGGPDGPKEKSARPELLVGSFCHRSRQARVRWPGLCCARCSPSSSRRQGWFQSAPARLLPRHVNEH